MTTALSSLRVDVTSNTSNYVSAMAAKTAADASAAASSEKLASAITSTNVTLGSGGTSIDALSQKYIAGWGAAQRFEQALASLQRAGDMGATFAQQVDVLSGMSQKFGLLADSGALAARGYESVAAAADVVNSKFASQTIEVTGAAAGFDLVGAALEKTKTSSGGMANALGTMNAQVLALATGMGPLGVIMAGFGPWGLAAAAGIGLVTSSIEALIEGSEDLAKQATSLQSFTEATGLSSDAIQALDESGAQFGLTADRIGGDVQNFTAAIGQAQQGTGTLFDSLLKVNPQLALQVSGAHDVAQAWNIVANAYQSAANAGNAAGAAAIARAAFGRNGATAGPALLSSTANAGGIQELGNAAAQAGGIIDSSLVQPLQQLQAEIDETNEHAKIMFESIYAPDVLQGLLALAQANERVAESLKSAYGNGSWLDRLGSIFVTSAVTGGYSPELPQTPSAPTANTGLGSSAATALNGAKASMDAITPSAAALYKATEQMDSALGAAVTPAQQLQLQILRLNAAVAENPAIASQAARAQGLLVEAFNVTQLQANISAMSALASPTQQYALAVAQLTLQLNEGKISQDAFNVGLINAQNTMNTSTESIKESYGIASYSDIASAAYTKMNADLAAIHATAPQSAAAVIGVNNSINKTYESVSALNSVTPNFTAFLNDLKNPDKTIDELFTNSGNAIIQAGQSFTQALQQGQTIAQAIATALTTAANSIANAFATAGAKQIAGSLLGGAAPSGVAGSMGSAISGALGLGSMGAGLATGGISMAIGAGISLITGSITQYNTEQQQWQQAQQNWADMQTQVASWTQQMDGGGNGTVTGALQQAQQQAQQYADAAHAAGQSADQINAALAQFADREVGDFIAGFDTMIVSLNSGLGPNSAAEQAAQNVQQVGTQLEGFVEDTVTVSNMIGGASAAVQAAEAASQSYALSLLQTPPALDSVETSFATIQGTAAQLQSVLQDLGMSADQAAEAIQSGVTEAIANLQVSFQQTLQQQINTANGNDWINQLQALEQSSGQNLLDANMLGVDPSLVAEAFQAQAQQIVDSAGLTGSAFQQLITLFPQLTSVVTQSTTAVAQEIAYYQQLQTQITSYLASLNTGSMSPLSPVDQLNSAQSTYQSQLALAQSGNQDALNNITSTASSYLQTAQSYYASGTGYASIFNQVQQDLQNLVPTAEASDPLTQIATNTATTNQILTVLQTLNTSQATSTTTIAQAIQDLGQLTQDSDQDQESSYFGPMTDYLSQIAANTATTGQAAQAPQKSTLDKIVTFDWGNLQTGGIVGRFAPGGLVGNGIYGIDSVRARYASGGDIMLAGGEFVTRAGAVNSATFSALQHINNTGHVPSNDNATNWHMLASTFTNVTGAAMMAQVLELRAGFNMLSAQMNNLTRAVQAQKRPTRPGRKAA